MAGKDRFTRYNEKINTIADAAADEVRHRAQIAARLYGPIENWSEDDKKSFKEDLTNIVTSTLDTHNNATQVQAQSVFARTVESLGVNGELTINGVDYYADTIHENMGSSAKLLFDDNNLEGMIAQCENFTRRTVSHAADDCVLGLASHPKVKKDIRFARVPTGPTCPFCLMLASRGFDYTSKEAAGYLGQYHNNCNCRIVPGKKTTKVPGYDPDGMLTRQRKCFETLGGYPRLINDWEKLPKSEKDKFGKGPRVKLEQLSSEMLERIGDNADAFNDYCRYRLQKEMATRDKEWLYSGKLPEIDYANNPRSTYGSIRTKSEKFSSDDYDPNNIFDRGNEWRDLFAHDALQNNGFKVSTFGSDSLDIKLNEVWYEVKSPEESTDKTSNNRRYIEGNLKKARKQFEKRNISPCRIVLSGRYREDASVDEIISELKNRKTGQRIDEIIYIDSKGNIHRI